MLGPDLRVGANHNTKLSVQNRILDGWENQDYDINLLMCHTVRSSVLMMIKVVYYT